MGRAACARGAPLTSDEMNGRQAHRMGTYVLSLAMVAIGLALIVQALSGHGGVISPRLLLGLLFIAAGAGRAYIEVRKGRGA
jgi:hypothetical protein